MAYWWVNQGESFKEELEEGILWAPIKTKDGRRPAHWTSMTEVRPGDTVIHYAGRVAALSVVTTAAVAARRPAQLPERWHEEGRLVRTAYREAFERISLGEVPLDWRTGHPRRGPFYSDGRVQQGYLFPLDDFFANRFMERFGNRFPDAPVLLPAEANDSAVQLLRRLLGREFKAPHGRFMRILDLRPPYVIIAMRSFLGDWQVPIADVQTALDELHASGRVTLCSDEIDDVRAFVGGVLLTLPGVELQGDKPCVIAARPVNASDEPSQDEGAITYEGDLSRPVTAEERGEQRALRAHLFGSHEVATCALCGDAYPVQFLVAAHIKKRSLCGDEERRDLSNVAMPACQFGCDALYETGYVSVDQSGAIVVATLESGGPLQTHLLRLEGRLCGSFTEESKPYFEWHYSTKFRG
ncbi:hypothetical protein [Actinoallomurus rhizosphaericola]|uniref:hypothetical protein n=1 Tax=Actinoallomurus rhizosphaericola TaxID=2952536 RepID=UPI002091BEE1|nr:hypothetical protein [Actinoallomurus rhizosphaericola]MCO5994797.1 hypothetical protein [Actinoallomurus rhizosphaericola]